MTASAVLPWFIRPQALRGVPIALPSNAPLTGRLVAAAYPAFTAPVQADIRQGHCSRRVGIAFDQLDARAIAPLRLSRREIRAGIAYLVRVNAVGGVL